MINLNVTMECIFIPCSCNSALLLFLHFRHTDETLSNVDRYIAGQHVASLYLVLGCSYIFAIILLLFVVDLLRCRLPLLPFRMIIVQMTKLKISGRKILKNRLPELKKKQQKTKNTFSRSIR